MIFFLSIALSYKYIIEQQPIGRELFRQFCETQPEYKKSIDFLDAVVSMSSDFFIQYWRDDEHKASIKWPISNNPAQGTLKLCKNNCEIIFKQKKTHISLQHIKNGQLSES